MLVFLGATAVVVLAEMADKTQLLAMAFACRFKATAVLSGVFVATVLNHALAVAAGFYLGTALNVTLVQSLAGASFILFGLWALRGDSLSGEEKRKTRLGPVLTVAIAFFLAEMGDKTQLATVALAAKYQSPLAVLVGTTSGMLVADAFGIFVGSIAGRRLPDAGIKWFSAVVFIGFGYLSLYASLPPRFVTLPAALLLVGLTAAGMCLALRFSRKTIQPDCERDSEREG